MHPLASVFDWFTGGSDHPYMTLFHCMHHDALWVGITVGLDLLVAAGYGVITLHWWRNARNLPPTPARKALGNIRNIFLFCCICGYTFIPIKMFWPAWRLYDVFMAALVWFTWRYAIGAKDLKVVYTELGRTARLTEQLEQSRAEMKRRTAFLNALSHDLRTPLNGIALHAEVARVSSQLNDPAAVQEAVVQISSSARAVAELLEGLLECARLDWHEEPNQVEAFAVIDLLREVMSAVGPLAAQKNLYIQASDANHLVMRTDRRKVERVLLNLLNNAVKFTEQGGIRIAIERAGNSVEIHVIDTGIGIPVEQQGRLFDEFYQVGNYERDREKGFGLGLSIARRLARQLGGDIAVESVAGSGSRFSLSLPGVVVRASGADNGSERQPAPVGG